MYGHGLQSLEFGANDIIKPAHNESRFIEVRNFMCVRQDDDLYAWTVIREHLMRYAIEARTRGVVQQPQLFEKLYLPTSRLMLFVFIAKMPLLFLSVSTDARFCVKHRRIFQPYFFSYWLHIDANKSLRTTCMFYRHKPKRHWAKSE